MPKAIFGQIRFVLFFISTNICVGFLSNSSFAQNGGLNDEEAVDQAVQESAFSLGQKIQPEGGEAGAGAGKDQNQEDLIKNAIKTYSQKGGEGELPEGAEGVEGVGLNQQEMMQNLLKNQGDLLKGRSQEDLERDISSRVASTPLGPFLKNYPKVITFLAKVLKEPKIMGGFMEVVANKEKLRNFQYAALGLLVFGFLLSLRGNKGLNFFQNLFKKVFLSLAITAGQILIVIFFFPIPSKHLWRIFKQVFLDG